MSAASKRFSLTQRASKAQAETKLRFNCREGFASSFQIGLAFVILLTASSTWTWGQAPRVLKQGELPNDQRLEPLKDLNGYFPFEVPASKEDWLRRRKELRRHLLVANGLWPLPTPCPLNAVIHRKVDRGDYTVEAVFFESMPGFFVTGSLYRPKNTDGKRPGILCPHGHWANGRFYDCGEGEVKQQVASGAELFVEGGRSPMQSRCVHLARMGAVVFHYDMIGYADSQQISYDLAHRFAKQRPEMNSIDRWGLFSPQAESRLQSVMGLQTYNSMRAIDFLKSLPDVDAERLAVTGASGGGTQTFMLAALDDRIQTAFPAVMVSTAMQGGCTCENCSLLRVGTGNVEIAALFAPKPMGLTAADDWTKEMESKGFPELKQLYELMGAGDQVRLTSRIEFGHNYNAVGREAMYRVFQPVLGLDAKFDEEDYRRMTTAEMTVWNDEHPKPSGGDDFERELLKRWNDDLEQQLTQLVPTNGGSREAYDEWVGGGVRSVIGREMPNADEVDWSLVEKFDRGDYLEMTGWVNQKKYNEALPVVFDYPKVWNGRVAIWLTAEGKSGLYDKQGKPNAAVSRMVESGVAVLGADLLLQGEFLKEGQEVEQTRRVANTREAAAYTFGYNPSLAIRRVHDVITLVGMIATDRDHEVSKLGVIGTGEAGRWVATAAPILGDTVDLIAVDTSGFRYAHVKEIHSPSFVPGGARYFDIPGFLSLTLAKQLVVAGEDEATVFPLQKVRATLGDSVETMFVDRDELVGQFETELGK